MLAVFSGYFSPPETNNNKKQNPIYSFLDCYDALFEIPLSLITTLPWDKKKRKKTA